MVIESQNTAKLRELLNRVCRRYGLFCLDDGGSGNELLLNFVASWFESWALIYSDEVDFRDLVDDPRCVETFLRMHSEVFRLASRGLYIYTAISGDEAQLAGVVRKLRILAAYRGARHG